MGTVRGFDGIKYQPLLGFKSVTKCTMPSSMARKTGVEVAGDRLAFFRRSGLGFGNYEAKKAL